MNHDRGGSPVRSHFTEAHNSLERILAIRELLEKEAEQAISPAVARSLEMADTYLFMALSYLGYSSKLYPEEE